MSQNITRRRFMDAVLSGAATLGLGLGMGLPPAASADSKKLKILVLGGTGFLGPPTVEYALSRGHIVTLFNRGKTNPQLFPGLEKLKGDRDGNLSALVGRQWDAVIDTSGYVPRIVRASAELLAPNTGQYLFISSISVYADLAAPGMDETAALATIDDPTVEEITGATYGALKALCEQAVRETLPNRSTVVRPGLIVGPGDRTDRFTYWPVRIARGGDVLAPAPEGQFTQFIDVRDVAEFIVRCLETDTTGVFNADRPADSLTMGEMLGTCKQVSGSDARLVWVPWSFLEQQNVRPWADLPAWLPASMEAAFGRISTARATAAGLTIRPLDDTVSATLAWWKELPDDRQIGLRAGLPPERETAVLRAWQGQIGAQTEG
jgi:2'-hydroxyisoflavone reductase